MSANLICVFDEMKTLKISTLYFTIEELNLF
jgi:hypothetical protein